MHRAVFFLGTLAVWIILLGWVAGAHWRVPLTSAQRVTFPGQEFREKLGRGEASWESLVVRAPGRDFTTLQTHSLRAVQAEQFPLLRYSFPDFPHSLELNFVFRRAGKTNDVEVVSLPWPGRGVSTYDLSRIEAWQGEIIEIGFAQYPTAQLTPPEKGFREFHLAEAALWSRSWQGALDVLVSDWLGYWPWALISVSAAGIAHETLRAPSLLLFLALGTACTVLLGIIVLGWRVRAIILAVAALWILLDLRWLSTLYKRNEDTRGLYANKPWEERAQLVADSNLLRVAKHVQKILSTFPTQTMVLLQGNSTYTDLRLYYHLLPANLALLGLAVGHVGHKALPVGAIVVFYQDSQWRYKQGALTMIASELSWPAQVLYESKDLQVYRIQEHAHP